MTITAARRLAVHDPRDGREIATYPLLGPAEVEAVVADARRAAAWWGQAGFSRRTELLQAWKRAIARRADDLAGVISAETGKTPDDALLEVMLTLTHLDWASKHARAVLRRRSVRPGLASVDQAASVGYEPYGVVGVVGPWNYPLYTPMGSVGYALAAGNAVVLKPSELAPGTAVWVAERWAEVCPDQPVLQVVTGDGATGDALVRSGVDKLAFTGSTATARRVLAAAAERLTPVVAECGGKDAMIVAADADVEAAAAAAAFGAVGNAGQTCAGVERVYVLDAVRDAFVEALVRRLDAARPGGQDDATYGPLTLERQSAVVAGHVEDALARGGRAVLGGPGSVRGRWVDPVVLCDVPQDAAAVQEETFGPTVVVNAVPDLDAAVDAANGTGYGLAASVFTKDARTARDVAARLRVGAVSVNTVLGFAGVPALPFGGRGDSGFGRVHGADGLREFSVPKSVARRRFRPVLDLLTLDRTPKDVATARRMLHLLHARGR